ncbi:MAG: type I-F CRISPR-associated protein Csy3 [Pseudomonadota bacterium]|nr:type I-F CRISPR-associated protein Csy3 [Pseudomonadota bacterium]
MKQLPAIVSFTRSIVITDGIMSSIMAGGSSKPVEVIRHGIRGTQNIVGDEDKVGGEAINVQDTDTAKLDANAVGLRVEFEMRMLALKDSLNACNDSDASKSKEFREGIVDFIDRANQSSGLIEVANRYARNIANGRWLWRNRTMAEKINVTARIGKDSIEFSALDIPLNSFGNYSNDEKTLGSHIARGMRGNPVSIEIMADVDFGIEGAIEVFPSQNYLSGKKDDPRLKGFARSLYKYGAPEKFIPTDNNRVGFAAIRDQKIGNALRTIDTWYPDTIKNNGLPIAVEPNGANIMANNFFRKNSESAFKLYLDLAKIDPNTEQGMFCIASLIRGGVYSGGDEGKTESKKKAGEVGISDN